MLFIVHGPTAAKALHRFEISSDRPKLRERAALERDLAELEAAAERVRRALVVPPQGA